MWSSEVAEERVSLTPASQIRRHKTSLPAQFRHLDFPKLELFHFVCATFVNTPLIAIISGRHSKMTSSNIESVRQSITTTILQLVGGSRSDASMFAQHLNDATTASVYLA